MGMRSKAEHFNQILQIQLSPGLVKQGFTSPPKSGRVKKNFRALQARASRRAGAWPIPGGGAPVGARRA
jgi:hypothetical protein